MMLTDRPFRELNLWQHIFAEHCEPFLRAWETQHHRCLSSRGEGNVQKRLSCGDIRQGDGESLCPHCQTTRTVGFTCKSRLCLRCFNAAVDGGSETSRQVLFEGVVHRQVVRTGRKVFRQLLRALPKLLKAFADAEARAVQPWVAPWRRLYSGMVAFVSFLLVHGLARFCLPQRLCVGSEIGAGLRRLAYGLRGAGTLKGRRVALVFA